MEKSVDKAVELISNWKPLPESLAVKIPPEILKLLVRVASELRARGLAGPGYRPPERLAAMMEIIKRLTGGTKPKNPLPAPRTEMEAAAEAAESRAIRTADAVTTRDQQAQLARMRL
jgi:hypothetical protein